MQILSKIKAGKLKLIWSFMNESENHENPSEENKWAIIKWKDVSRIEIIETPRILVNANKLVEIGLRVGDALHLASAVEGKADFFLTTDDKILRKVFDFEGVIVLDPIRMVEKMDEYAN